MKTNKHLTFAVLAACVMAAAAVFAQPQTAGLAPYQDKILTVTDGYLAKYKLSPSETEDLNASFQNIASARADAVRQNPAKYFERHIRKALPATEEKLARFVNTMEEKVWNARAVARYNRLQNAIARNKTVFPGYTLMGQADLVALENQTMDALEAFFAAQDASSAPQVKVTGVRKTQVRDVTEAVGTRIHMILKAPEQKLRVAVDVENRVITILAKGQKYAEQKYDYPAPVY